MSAPLASAVAPFEGNGDNPDPFSVVQAHSCTGDCWLIAALVGLAKQRPEDVKAMIRPLPDGGCAVTLFGRIEVRVGPADNPDLWARSNGPWASVIERAYAQYQWQRRRKGTVHQRVNRPAWPGEGIRALTGRRVDTDWLGWTWPRTTRRKLRDALDNLRVVTAMTAYWGKKRLSRRDLAPRHLYSVLDHDPAADRVRLRNPWSWGRGHDADQPPPAGADDGVFWLSLGEFSACFSLVAYERDR